MRIAVVSSYLTGGGAELYVRQLVHSLRELHETLVLSESPPPGDDEISWRRLPGQSLLSDGASTTTKALWHFRDQWQPSVFVATRRALRAFQPDVVSTHNVQGLSAAVFSAIAAEGVAHLHTAHDLSLLCAETTMTRDGVYCGGRCASCLVQRGIRGRLAAGSIDRVVCVSDMVRQRLIAARVFEPARTTTIRHGAKSSHPRLRSLEAAGPARIGFIGALSDHKGVKTLLRAFEDAPPAWSLKIAGDGPLTAAVRRTAEKNARVTYLGRVDGEAKAAFYDSVDVIVIPSECEEAATFVAVEAAAAGIPAVVSDRGGLPETPHARVFRAGCPSELAAAITWFCGDGRLESASRRLISAQNEFRWETHVERLALELERTIEEATTRRPTEPDLGD